jgi:hypothetical protein
VQIISNEPISNFKYNSAETIKTVKKPLDLWKIEFLEALIKEFQLAQQSKKIIQQWDLGQKSSRLYSSCVLQHYYSIMCSYVNKQNITSGP